MSACDKTRKGLFLRKKSCGFSLFIMHSHLFHYLKSLKHENLFLFTFIYAQTDIIQASRTFSLEIDKLSTFSEITNDCGNVLKLYLYGKMCSHPEFQLSK